MRFIVLSLIALLTTCNLDENASDRAVARVNDQYLLTSELAANVRSTLTTSDSIASATNYINTWAIEQLLLDKAVFNLNAQKQEELERLIKRYRNDLYIKTYQEEWLKARVDTLVTQDEIDTYYQSNKKNFKLHQDLMRGRYIKLPLVNFNKESIKRALRRFNDDDRTYLDSISLQFNSALLNDSIWLRPQTFFAGIDRPTPTKYKSYLKSNRFFEIEDSLDLYLVFVEEVRRRNETAPMVHIRSTLKQILLNKRKLDMMRRFDRDILQEAVKKNVFEIYE
jgi:hypothetical protein